MQLGLYVVAGFVSQDTVKLYNTYELSTEGIPATISMPKDATVTIYDLFCKIAGFCEDHRDDIMQTLLIEFPGHPLGVSSSSYQIDSSKYRSRYSY